MTSSFLNLLKLNLILLFLILGFIHFAFAENHQALPIKGGFFLQPNSVSIVRFSNGYDVNCSGVLIASNAIVTSGHCVKGKEKSIKKGEFLISTGAESVWSASGVRNSRYDVAVVKLRTKIRQMRVVKLPPALKIPYGQSVLVAGVGYDEYGNLGYLKALYMTIIGGTASSFQAQDLNYGDTPCYGDSGGPAIVTLNRKQTVIGIVKQGLNGCPYGYPVTFLRLDYKPIKDFIQNELRKK